MLDSLLYNKKFGKTPKRNGFQLDPYYPCVENRLVNNKQQTICFHVEDFKISHQDSKANEEFINTFRDEYESLFEDLSEKWKRSE